MACLCAGSSPTVEGVRGAHSPTEPSFPAATSEGAAGSPPTRSPPVRPAPACAVAAREAAAADCLEASGPQAGETAVGDVGAREEKGARGRGRSHTYAAGLLTVGSLWHALPCIIYRSGADTK